MKTPNSIAIVILHIYPQYITVSGCDLDMTLLTAIVTNMSNGK